MNAGWCSSWLRQVFSFAIIVATACAGGGAHARQTDPTGWLDTTERTESWLEGTATLRDVLSRVDPNAASIRKWLPRLKARCQVLARFADLDEAKRKIYAEQTTVMAEDLAAGQPPFRRYAGQNIPYVYWSDYLQELQGTRFVVPRAYDPAKEYQIFLYYKLGGGLVWKDTGGKWVAPDTPGAKFADPYQPTLAQCLRTPDTFHTWSALTSQTKGRMGQHTELIDMPRAFCADFSISPDRVFLSGFSDGGFDALFIGCYYPHLVAGIAPGVANWQYTNVGQVGLFNVPTLVLDGWGDAGYVAENFARIQTLGNMGYPIEGLFSQTGHSDQLWATDEIFFPMIEWARQQRRNLWPKRVRYATWNLHWHRAYWMSLERIIDPALAALIDIQVDGNTFTAQTRNVAAYRLSLCEKLVDPRQTVKVVNNGQVLYDGPYREDLLVEVTSAPKSVYKTPQLPGGMTVAVDRSAYTGNVGISRSLNIPGQEWTIVLPDRCTPSQKTAYAGFLPQARAANEITLDEAGRNHLILVGTPRENSLLEKIADKLPVQFSEDGFRVGSKVYEKPQHAVRFVCPNPLNRSRYLIVAACNDVGSARRGEFFGKRQKMFVPSPWSFREGDCQVLGVDSPEAARYTPKLGRGTADYYTWTTDWKVPDETPIGRAEQYFDYESLQVLVADAVREAMDADVGVVGRFPPGFNQWRGWLDAGPITRNQVATLRMLPEFIVTAEVTGEQLRRIVERSVATTVKSRSVLPSRPGQAGSPVPHEPASLTLDDIDDESTYRVAADYTALDGGPLRYTHDKTGFKQIPNYLRFDSIARLLEKTEDVVLTCSNLKQSDVQVSEAVAAYIKRRGTIRPRQFVGDLDKYLTNPHAHACPKYDWWHLEVPFGFVVTANGTTVRRRDTLSIGLTREDEPDLGRPRPNSKHFQSDLRARSPVVERRGFRGLDKGLPVDISTGFISTELKGSPFPNSVTRENPVAARGGRRSIGMVTLVTLRLTNDGSKRLLGKVLLGLGEPVRYSCRWPGRQAPDAERRVGEGIVETVGRPREALATHGAVLLHDGAEPKYEEIRRNLAYNFGLLGLKRDIEIAPGETATLRLLLFGVNSEDREKGARPDIREFVEVVEKKM